MSALRNQTNLQGMIHGASFWGDALSHMTIRNVAALRLVILVGTLAADQRSADLSRLVYLARHGRAIRRDIQDNSQSLYFGVR